MGPPAPALVPTLLAAAHASSRMTLRERQARSHPPQLTRREATSPGVQQPKTPPRECFERYKGELLLPARRLSPAASRATDCQGPRGRGVSRRGSPAFPSEKGPLAPDRALFRIPIGCYSVGGSQPCHCQLRPLPEKAAASALLDMCLI